MSQIRRSYGWRQVSIVTAMFVSTCCAAICDVAAAEELTRSEYVAKLEAHCKPATLKIERRVDGVREDVHRGRLKVAGEKFKVAAKIFGRSVQSVAPVPRPKEDRKQLATWFMYLHQQERYMLKIADAFGHERGTQGQRYVARFVHSGNLSNNAVFGWGFNYCAFKFSRYG